MPKVKGCSTTKSHGRVKRKVKETLTEEVILAKAQITNLRVRREMAKNLVPHQLTDAEKFDRL